MSSHKTPEVLRWLARHPRWTFHFTPTSSSWLSAVEGFFAKLTRRRLKYGAFTGVVDLQAAINRFISEHNETEASTIHLARRPRRHHRCTQTWVPSVGVNPLASRPDVNFLNQDGAVANSIVGTYFYDGAGSTTSLGLDTVTTSANIFAATQTFVDIDGDGIQSGTYEVSLGAGIAGGVSGNNGGPVQTIALAGDAANPALDGGDEAEAPSTDARGETRPVDLPFVGTGLNGRTDLGALELQSLETTALESLVVTTLEQSANLRRDVGGTLRCRANAQCWLNRN